MLAKIQTKKINWQLAEREENITFFWETPVTLCEENCPEVNEPE
jgi:hypothetical protein